MDETYIKVKGKWVYYYRAIDKFGKTLNLAGLENMNCLLIMNGWFWLIDILQVKYLN
jgi:putative transposase